MNMHVDQGTSNKVQHVFTLVRTLEVKFEGP